MFHQLEFGYLKYITSYSFLNIVGLKLVVSLHSDSDVQKKKRVCQNVHILFFMHKAPTFSSQGFAIS